MDLDKLSYQAGFGNELETEAIEGALPVGQNQPQRCPYGLISELVSGTAFTAPRALNRRSYVFRIRPSVTHGRFELTPASQFLTPPFDTILSPNQMRWSPFPVGAGVEQDFLDSIVTICGNGSPLSQVGMSIHLYRATKDMVGRFFVDADGELLVLPYEGSVLISTEMGRMHVQPGEFALIPKGIKFRVELPDGTASGYLCENYGVPFRLPELGPIGANGLANTIDFQIPTAWFEEGDEACTVHQKIGGNIWVAELDHSPLDVVAWRGTLYPAKYDMHRFMALGSVTFDGVDPSLYCALTAPGDPVLGGNADFLVVPPRWSVTDHTFRAPSYHRNSVAEFYGLIYGNRESNSSNFGPGGFTIHNNWAAHGPDTRSFNAASKADLVPEQVAGGLAFMFESRLPLLPTRFAYDAEELQPDYRLGWQDFTPEFSSPTTR